MNKRLSKLDPSQLFDSGSLDQDLARKSIRGGAVTLISQGGLFGINMLRTIILVRLLLPSDFGLVGMVTVIIGFATMFKEAGLALATVQRDEISEAQISSLFWINVGISLTLGLLIALSSPVVAWFYGREELVAITLALAGPFVLSGAQIQHLALLRRHMLFNQLAVITILTNVGAAAVAVWMAWSGYTYWALVGALWANAILSLGLTFFFCPWVPSRYQRGADVRSMLVFGGHMTGFNVVNFFARNLDKILIGRFLGDAALGYYGRAYALMMQPLQNLNGPLRAVGTPALSRLQNDEARYRRYFQQAGGMLLLLTMPLAAFLFITADDLIGVLFGPQWTQAITPFRWLSLCVVSQPLGNIVGWLYVSQGRARDLMQWGIIGSIIAILSIVGGLPWGIDGVAASYGMTSVVISTPLLFWYAGRKGFVSSGLLGRMFVSKLGYLALFAAGHGLLDQLLQTTSAGALLRLVVHSLVFGAGLTAVFALAPDAKRLRELLLEAIQARRGRSEP